MHLEFLIIWILIWSLFWGFICSAVGKAKNIEGFLWGFFFGFVGLIIVASLPAKEYKTTESYIKKEESQNKFNKYDALEKLSTLKEKGAITKEEFEKEKQKLLK